MNKKVVGALCIGGGVAGLGALFFFGKKKEAEVTNSIADAVAGKGPGPQADDVPPVAANNDSTTLPATPPGGAQVKIRTTGYWPFVSNLDAVARKMEGGTNDRKGKPLYTLEMFQAGSAPFVSVSGDPTIWPYGQRIALDFWPGVVFRVVDTGSHFTGAGKVYRMAGYEPLDICVASSKTKVPITATATIFPGDTFDKPSKAIATSGLKGQNVSLAGNDAQGVAKSGNMAAKVAAAEIIYGLYHDELAKGL